MAKVFHPRVEMFVNSSTPHPPNTQYRIGIGEEEWDGGYVPVLKVQMVYDGVVNGRRAPSYPLGSDDEKRVRDAIDKLKDENRDLIARLA